MKRKKTEMKRFTAISAILFLLSLFGCQATQETKIENTQSSNISIQPAKTEAVAVKSEKTSIVDVPKLANKPADELDKIFGKPEESKKQKDGGEYRLYKIANQSKGLAVRFYGGKAKNFNLILEKPLPTSKDALKQAFGIDVGNAAPTKDAKEPLTEKYQGTFGGVKFTKVSAKRQENGGGFIFVLAEVE
jgi:hypothetical protein